MKLHLKTGYECAYCAPGLIQRIEPELQYDPALIMNEVILGIVGFDPEHGISLVLNWVSVCSEVTGD